MSNAFLDSAVVHACEERWEETLQLLQRASSLPDIVMQLGKKMGVQEPWKIPLLMA